MGTAEGEREKNNCGILGASQEASITAYRPKQSAVKSWREANTAGNTAGGVRCKEEHAGSGIRLRKDQAGGLKVR